MRRRIGLEHGGPILLRVEDGVIRIRTVRDALLRVQQRARELFGGADSIDRFIADRRAGPPFVMAGLVPAIHVPGLGPGIPPVRAEAPLRSWVNLSAG